MPTAIHALNASAVRRFRGWQRKHFLIFRVRRFSEFPAATRTEIEVQKEHDARLQAPG
jgi:hypothetical protein